MIERFDRSTENERCTGYDRLGSRGSRASWPCDQAPAPLSRAPAAVQDIGVAARPHRRRKPVTNRDAISGRRAPWGMANVQCRNADVWCSTRGRARGRFATRPPVVADKRMRRSAKRDQVQRHQIADSHTHAGMQSDEGAGSRNSRPRGRKERPGSSLPNNEQSAQEHRDRRESPHRITAVISTRYGHTTPAGPPTR